MMKERRPELVTRKCERCHSGMVRVVRTIDPGTLPRVAQTSWRCRCGFRESALPLDEANYVGYMDELAEMFACAVTGYDVITDHISPDRLRVSNLEVRVSELETALSELRSALRTL